MVLEKPMGERVAVLEALRVEDIRLREERRVGTDQRFDTLEGKVDSLHKLVEHDISQRNGNGRWHALHAVNRVATPTVGGASGLAIILWLLQRL